MVAFLLFARLQFRFELGSFLFEPARERMMFASRAAAFELLDTPRADWTKLLERLGTEYPAQFYLFDEDGAQLAGKSTVLPPTVLQHIREGRFQHPQDHHRNAPDAQGPPPFEGQPPQDFGPRPDGPPPDDPAARPGQRNSVRPALPPSQRNPRQWRADALMSVLKTTGPAEYWALAPIPLWNSGRPDPVHAVLLWRIHSLWTKPFFFDGKPWLAISLVIIVISAACWIPLVRGLTHSISTVTQATTQIATGHFDVKLRTRRRDELGSLSESINRMAERLSGYVYGQKRFLGDVAHELSSPLARTQVALSILEQRITDEPNCTYIRDVEEEVEHMSTLVNELLSFSKAQVAFSGTELRAVSVAEAVERVLRREATNGSNIQVKVDESVRVLASADSLVRALANVVRNAIRYAGAAGSIEILANEGSGRVAICVADCGPGIPENELENVFRPFYRPEFARQRETGGTGLGLAIVRDCVESCGGSVLCRNRTPHGLEVVIELAAAGERAKVLPVSQATV